MSERRERDVEEDWDFWRPIIYPTGLLDLEQLKCELSDYSMLLEYAPRVYMHATGDQVSAPNTLPEVVMAQIDDHVESLCLEAVEDFKDERGLGPLLAYMEQHELSGEEVLEMVQELRAFEPVVRSMPAGGFEFLPFTPESWSMDQIKQFQSWFDQLLEGDPKVTVITGEPRK